MENWTRISFSSDAVTAEEIAVRARLHAAVEKAMDTYFGESKEQDIHAVEMFPTE